MFCLSVRGFLNVVGPVRCMRETSGTLSRNHNVSSRGIERLGTVRPERVLPETRRLPLMVEEEVRAFEFWSSLVLPQKIFAGIRTLLKKSSSKNSNLGTIHMILMNYYIFHL